MCCGPALDGSVPAPGAEALMRSRYSAFALGRIDHLLATTHSSTRAQHDAAGMAAWSARADWQGLTVKRVVAGQPGMMGAVVVFTARWREDGHDQTMREASWFVCEDGRWYYVDGSGEERLARRKAPCICGSGKPLKRCCLR